MGSDDLNISLVLEEDTIQYVEGGNIRPREGFSAVLMDDGPQPLAQVPGA
ncbi:MAG TPA: hypothetical protein VMA54_12420 [Steroidobacteraceae bacterium]|nr:hypothetical protein [Steroidobacteraceae bacterium]